MSAMRQEQFPLMLSVMTELSDSFGGGPLSVYVVEMVVRVDNG